MCLATVYDKKQEPECILFSYTSMIEVDGNKITLTNVMGEQKVVEGTIKMVDLAGGVVEINCL